MVFQAVTGEDPFHIAGELIGSNIVKGTRMDSALLRTLPADVQRCLRIIQTDGAHGSANYYFPFFANYALRLTSAVQKAGALLSNRGVGVIFVRDTPRKDVLFPTAMLVISALKKSGCIVNRKESRLIRGHIGMRRRGEHRSLQGLAQREWWLLFRRK
jgi:hypothetical protein